MGALIQYYKYELVKNTKEYKKLLKENITKSYKKSNLVLQYLTIFNTRFDFL